MNPTIVVLGSGANRGLLQLGILSSIDLSHVHTYVGTSVGALVGYFCALGYTPEELFGILRKRQLFEANKVFSILEELKYQYEAIRNNIEIPHSREFHIFDDDYFKNVINELTYNKININADELNLQDLYEMTGKNVVMATCNYTKETTEYLSKDTSDVDCLEALLMTSSAPIFFPSVLSKDNVYIDGGITCSFPIKYATENIKKDGDVILGVNLKGKCNSNLVSYIFSMSEITATISERDIMPEQERFFICDSKMFHNNLKYLCYMFKENYIIDVWNETSSFSNLSPESRDAMYTDGRQTGNEVQDYLKFVTGICEVIIQKNNSAEENI